MAKKRGRSARAAEGIRQDRIWTSVLGLIVLVLGLVFAGVTGGYRWYQASKVERLRADGVPVVAQVLERRNTMGRGGGRDTIVVSYAYQETTYTKRILCDGPSGCKRNPPSEIFVRVDPAKPEDFVTNNGSTDDSVFFFNSNGGIPYGMVISLVGGGMLSSAWLAGRQSAAVSRSRGKSSARCRPSSNRRQGARRK